MSDEAHYYLNGMMNQPNCHYWALENPKELHAKPLPKVTVWCTDGKAVVIGSYFFEDNNGNAVIMNSERYTKMINKIMTKTCAYLTCLVSAGWNDGPHSQSINGHASPSFRWLPHFQVCWRSFPTSVSWFIHLWLFLEGMPQGTYLWA